jgi:hypothetical protein
LEYIFQPFTQLDNSTSYENLVFKGDKISEPKFHFLQKANENPFLNLPYEAMAELKKDFLEKARTW